MESTTGKNTKEAQRRADIRKQIAELQSQLNQGSPESLKRTNRAESVLAPATPSPKKRSGGTNSAESPTKRAQNARSSKPIPMPVVPTGRLHTSDIQPMSLLQAPQNSHIVLKLKELSYNKHTETEQVVRSEGFAEKAVLPKPDVTLETVRDDRLALVEKLELGPVEHRAMAGDPNFEKHEPNSGIRLSSRILSHNALQDHLSGRYYLSPSHLYSVVRLLPNKQAYDVPVEGDWVTIAVVAERGEVKFTQGPGNSKFNKRDDEDILNDSKDNVNKKRAGEIVTGKKRSNDEEEDDQENSHKSGKKYVHLKLVDLGHRSRSTTSSSSRPILRGDAQLSLLLFESDYFDKLVTKDENGKDKTQKIWRGGSGGAFEECYSKLREGTVIALLNPKVLRPFQNSRNPASSMLALTPPSAAAIALIGRALDLGMCTVRRKDGKVCGAWVDKRPSASDASSSKKGGDDVCEYHIQTAVQRARAGRPEFSIGTSGMSTTAHTRAKGNPERRWGLQPEHGLRGTDGEVTFVLGGHIARSQAPGIASETMGREGQARAKRRREEYDGENALKEQLGRSSKQAGSSYRYHGSKEALGVVEIARRSLLSNKQCGAANSKDSIDGQCGNADDKQQTRTSSLLPENPKKTYSAEMVKRLGFDPLKVHSSHGGINTKAAGHPVGKVGQPFGYHQRRIFLGRPPGEFVRSGVKVPDASAMENARDATLSRSQPGNAEDDLVGTDDSQGRHYEDRPVTSSIRADTPRSCSISVAAVESDSDLEVEPSVS